MATNYCNICGSKETFLCGGCNQAHYCSKECQKKDWPIHRQTCANQTDTEQAHTLTNLLNSLEKTSILRKLSCLKQYAINHNLGKGTNCFTLIDLSVISPELLADMQKSMKTTSNMYLVNTEHATSVFPNHFTPDKLYIGMASKSGTSADVACMKDTPLPRKVVEETALVIFVTSSRIRNFFSSTAANTNENALLLVPDKDDLFPISMTSKGITIMS